MALNINGTTGISGVDGSASAPALQGSDSNTGVSFGSDFIAFNTGGTERARFADSGNFGINRTTPNFPFVARRTDASGLIAEFANNGGYGLWVGQNSATGEAYLRTGSGQPLAFVTNGGSGLANERMRIHANAYISFGTTSTNPTNGGSVLEGEYGHLQLSRTGTNSETMIRFNRDGSTRGSIVVSTSTTYNTSSDYRLKENVTNLTDALTRLKKVTPRRFSFIDDKDNQLIDGFIAHEVSTAVPEAVTGTKDQVELADDNEKGIKKGDPIYQQLDYSKFVPLLTAALQEEVAKREALEARVAALEAA